MGRQSAASNSWTNKQKCSGPCGTKRFSARASMVSVSIPNPNYEIFFTRHFPRHEKMF